MHEREQRVQTSIPVKVYHDGQERLAEAGNVSLSGACLIGTGQLPAKAPVTIRYRNLCLEAQVAWSSGRVTGVQFLAPLSPEDFRRFQVGQEARWAPPACI